MLRVTPLYGSRWDNSGVSRSGSCTLIEYADIKVLVDVGIRNNNNNNNTQNKIGNGDNDDDNNNNNNNTSTSTTASKCSSESFWENLPPHDCLVLTDSTLESMGSLPLYVEGIRRAAKKRRHNRLVEIRLRNRRRRSSIQKQQHQQQAYNRRRSSSNAANYQLEEEELLLDNDDDDDKDYMDLVPPIFATFPTVKMGQMSLYDYHANISLDGCKPSFTLEEMDRSISLIRTIKYSQTLSLPFPLMEAPPSPFVSKTINNNNNKKDEGNAKSNNKPRLAITAHMAGHVVGGAFYKFVRLRDETSVVITHVYHIARELHLDAATLLRDGSGVDVLITYPGGSASCPLINTLYSTNSNSNSSNNKKIKQSAIMKSPLVSKVRRDITERILGLLRRDANVLLPVDASGRSLELVLLLDRFWSRNNLSNTFNLVWFGPMVHNTLEFTRSQLEWMNSVLSANIFDHSQNNKKGGRRKNRFSQDKAGGTGTEQGGDGDGDGDFDRGGHPYALRNVKLCTNMAELEKIISSSNDNPTCVLANGLSLDHGKFTCTALHCTFSIIQSSRTSIIEKGNKTVFKMK
jgi:Cft2 family RNA processing exonuclease